MPYRLAIALSCKYLDYLIDYTRSMSILQYLNSQKSIFFNAFFTFVLHFLFYTIFTQFFNTFLQSYKQRFLTTFNQFHILISIYSISLQISSNPLRFLLTPSAISSVLFHVFPPWFFINTYRLSSSSSSSNLSNAA